MKNETTANHNQNIKKIGELIAGIDIAMLTTAGEDGRLFSRPMATQKVDFDGDLYFFTYDNSPKSVEIQHDAQVNVAYSHPSKNDYVSVSGHAQIVHDQAKMKELWNPIYNAWFPQGLETPHIALLKVTAESAEYWDSPSGLVASVIALAQNALGGEKKIGDHAKVEL